MNENSGRSGVDILEAYRVVLTLGKLYGYRAAKYKETSNANLAKAVFYPKTKEDEVYSAYIKNLVESTVDINWEEDFNETKNRFTNTYYNLDSWGVTVKNVLSKSNVLKNDFGVFASCILRSNIFRENTKEPNHRHSRWSLMTTEEFNINSKLFDVTAIVKNNPRYSEYLESFLFDAVVPEVCMGSTLNIECTKEHFQDSLKTGDIIKIDGILDRDKNKITIDGYYFFNDYAYSYVNNLLKKGE